jgi:hypothetical protein
MKTQGHAWNNPAAVTGSESVQQPHVPAKAEWPANPLAISSLL